MTMLATIPVLTTHNNTVGLTKQSDAERAVNQLLSVVVGRYSARATDNLKDNPSDRVQECMRLALEEYQNALKELASNPDGQRQVQQAQRKMDSLSSLQVLANLISEVTW